MMTAAPSNADVHRAGLKMFLKPVLMSALCIQSPIAVRVHLIIADVGKWPSCPVRVGEESFSFEVLSRRFARRH